MVCQAIRPSSPTSVASEVVWVPQPGEFTGKSTGKKGVRIIQNIPSAQAGWGDQQKQKGWWLMLLMFMFIFFMLTAICCCLSPMFIPCGLLCYPQIFQPSPVPSSSHLSRSHQVWSILSLMSWSPTIPQAIRSRDGHGIMGWRGVSRWRHRLENMDFSTMKNGDQRWGMSGNMMV